MMNLMELLREAGVPSLGPIPEVMVDDVVADSRKARPGAVFCAVRGTTHDGNDWAERALAAGCVAVLTDRKECARRPGHVLVPSSHGAVGPLARALWGKPDAGMKTISVTGTNGKTSTVFLAEAMLREAGLAPALSSTVVVRCPGRETKADMTTPDAVKFWEFVRDARDAGAKSLAVEVSSHALHQGRIGGLACDAAIFTNLTRDHLDYHGTMSEYFAAKSLLFTRHLKPGGVAIVNLDDAYGRILSSHLGDRCRGVSFIDAGAAWRVLDLRTSLEGNRFRLVSKDVDLVLESPLVGEVFARNLAGAAAAALEMGIDPESVRRAAASTRVPGRCQVVRLGRRRGVVDYAHTPDALERLLEGLRPLVAGRLVSVFGCGGGRDHGKRPMMGGIAARLSDLAFATSDNPRMEDPEAILDEVFQGIPDPANVRRQVDRREAIRAAVASCGPDDLVVVAGKGHEDYQTVGTEKRHFDDVEEVEAAFRSMEERR
jgi:UDP-N-acetylmuramoyl-L-alanyl-D-glutamate--2,6-diaminopimelate ligase